jgi:hemerythrin-like domain-containing protein
MRSSPEFLTLIHEEHEELKSMMERIKSMPERDSDGKENMFNQLKSELIPHMRGEEKAFYPVLRGIPDTKMDAMLALEEHHIAEVSLVELDKMSKEEEFWAPKFSVFSELINHHIKEEESQVFQGARDNLSGEQFQEILTNYKSEKETAKGKVTASMRQTS